MAYFVSLLTPKPRTTTHATRAYWPAMALLVVLLASGVGPGPVGPVTAQSQPEHDPIVIDGDNDLCNGEGNGIVNCDTADGTPEDPYIISDIHIIIGDPAACDAGQGQPVVDGVLACTQVARCTADGAPLAGVSICNVTRSLVLRNIKVTVFDRPAVVAVYVAGARDVRLEATQLSAEGQALQVTAPESGPARVVLRDSTLASTASAPVNGQTAFVDVLGGDLIVENSRINATGHLKGLEMHGRDEGDDRFSMVGTEVSAASRLGLFVGDAHVTIIGSRFVDVGVAGSTVSITDPVGLWLEGTTAIHLDVDDRPYRFTNNFVEVRGTGLYIADGPPGVVEWNNFTAEAPEDATRPIAARFNEDSCTTRFWYNDVEPRMRIQHGPGSAQCALDARFVWWGQPTGPNLTSVVTPQIEGPALHFPHLHVPIAKLPVVHIEEPQPGARALGRVHLSGTAASPHGEKPVSRVNVTVGGNWTNSQIAEGTSQWSLDFDLSQQAFGPVTLEVHACTPDHCGATSTITVLHAAPPKPPVAVLHADHRVLYVNEPVLLDGSASFGSDGTGIAAYRFSFGDRRDSGWQSEPYIEVQYNQSGTYVTSLQVRDETGNRNQNNPSLVLRVRDPDHDGVALADAPGAPALAAVLVVVLCAWGLSRGVVRRP